MTNLPDYLIAYASRTGTGRNLDAMRAINERFEAEVWRILISRSGVWRTEGFRHCLDNGVWPDFQLWLRARVAEGMKIDDAVAQWAAGRWCEVPFDEATFEVLIDRFGAQADFVILPDIVAGGPASLERSLRWMNRARSACDLVLIAVQDGMVPEDVRSFVGPNVGIFMGGSTPWKLRNIKPWGDACAEWEVWYHVGRVNTERRFRLAHDGGATSTDGSSVTRFAKTMPLLERARHAPSLVSPRRYAA